MARNCLCRKRVCFE